MSPIWRLCCLSSYPPSWHSLLFVRCLMLWLESGCAEVNVSKWRCLNNKGPVRNGFVLTIRLCAKASFTKKKELSQSRGLVGSCCCMLQSRALQWALCRVVINPVMILQILSPLHYIPHEEDLDWPSPKCPFHCGPLHISRILLSIWNNADTRHAAAEGC